jgi:hypothetical protein
MVSDSDSDIISWTGVGDSFTIKDIDAFQKTVLPKYFNHSKFSSFVRQLNFYGFQKLSQESDIIRTVPQVIKTNASNNNNDDESSHAESLASRQQQTQQNPSSNGSVTSSRTNNSARFMHEYFRRGMPELLAKIQRSTAKPKVPVMEPEEYQALHQKIAALQTQVSQLESQMDQKVEQAVQLVRQDYMSKVTQLEVSYQSLVSVLSLLLNGKPTLTGTPSTSALSLHSLLGASKNI